MRLYLSDQLRAEQGTGSLKKKKLNLLTPGKFTKREMVKLGNHLFFSFPPQTMSFNPDGDWAHTKDL